MRLPVRFTLAMVVLVVFTAATTGLVTYWFLKAGGAGIQTPPTPAATVGSAEAGPGGVGGLADSPAVVRRAVLIAGIVSVLLAVVLAARMSRWLTRPLAEMSSAVQAFARGESVPLPTRDPGPIGALARAFSQMTADVRAKTAALETQIEEQRRAEKTLGGLIVANPHAIVVTNDRREVHLVNEAAVTLFGRPREELLRQPFPFALEPGKTTVVDIVRGDHRRSAELCVGAVEWRGEPALLAILTDTTERTKLAEQLRQAQKLEALGRLAGGVAHDFNNLLTIINMSMDLLMSDSLAGSPRAQQLLTEIRSAGDWAASLTAQLLAFSRKSASAPRAVDLNSVVRELEPLVRRLLGEPIEVATVLDPALGLVKADPSHLEQVIMNLAVNAHDAMPNGGHLTLETHTVELDEAYAQAHVGIEPGSYVQLAVSDTGSGMTAEVKAHLFEPFFTTKGPERGTGLGLSTVYGIVTQMGGHITVYSEPEKGTTFRVYLPRRIAGIGSTPSQPQRFEIPVGDETILLVEDNATIRQLTRIVLESYGYTVLEAENGLRALEAAGAATRHIDLVITDVVMPRMGGRQLVERLRAARGALRVLYMSGYTDEVVVRYGEIQAGDPFIQKPFSPAGLANKVRLVLDELPL